MAIRNYYKKDEWMRIVTATLINCGYPQTLVLDSKAWGCLFDEQLHPLDAINESEGFYPIAAYQAALEQ